MGLETDVSEAMLPPSSGLTCTVKEIHTLNYCLPIEVLHVVT
jgi:hypothetical protein